MTNGPSGESANGRAIRSPLTLADLMADLEWPKLLRAPALGLNPGRVVLAFLALVATAVLFNAGLWLDARAKNQTTEERWVAVQAQVADVAQASASEGVYNATGAWRLAVRLPVQLVRKFPLTTLVFGPL